MTRYKQVWLHTRQMRNCSSKPKDKNLQVKFWIIIEMTIAVSLRRTRILRIWAIATLTESRLTKEAYRIVKRIAKFHLVVLKTTTLRVQNSSIKPWKRSSLKNHKSRGHLNKQANLSSRPIWLKQQLLWKIPSIAPLINNKAIEVNERKRPPTLRIIQAIKIKQLIWTTRKQLQIQFRFSKKAKVRSSTALSRKHQLPHYDSSLSPTCWAKRNSKRRLHPPFQKATAHM